MPVARHVPRVYESPLQKIWIESIVSPVASSLELVIPSSATMATLSIRHLRTLGSVTHTTSLVSDLIYSFAFSHQEIAKSKLNLTSMTLKVKV